MHDVPPEMGGVLTPSLLAWSKASPFSGQPHMKQMVDDCIILLDDSILMDSSPVQGATPVYIYI